MKFKIGHALELTVSPSGNVRLSDGDWELIVQYADLDRFVSAVFKAVPHAKSLRANHKHADRAREL